MGFLTALVRKPKHEFKFVSFGAFCRKVLTHNFIADRVASIQSCQVVRICDRDPAK